MIGRRRAGGNRARDGVEGGKGRRGGASVFGLFGLCEEVTRVSQTHKELASAINSTLMFRYRIASLS